MSRVVGSTEASQHCCNSDMKGRALGKEKELNSDVVEKSLAVCGVD